MRKLADMRTPSRRRYPTPTEFWTYDGKTMSRSAWAREIGVSYSTLQKRVEKFGDSPEAMPFVLKNGHYPKAGKVKYRYTYNGEKYTIKELASAFKISEGRLRERLSAGWDLDRALKTDKFTAYSEAKRISQRSVLASQGRLITIDGIADTVNGHARRKGLTIKLVKSRIHERGWTRERALTTPVMTREEILNASVVARQKDVNAKRLASFGVIL